MSGRDPAAAAAAVEALASTSDMTRLYEHYDTLRSADPIHESQHEDFPRCWFISRHEDLYAVLRDKRFVQDARNSEVFAGSEGPFADMVSRILIFLPPGPHERTRGLIYRAFTPKEVERRRPRIETVIQELIAGVAARGGGDLLEDVLYPLPMTVICELLGATPEERDMLSELFAAQGHEVSDVGSASDSHHAAADQMIVRFSEEVKRMLERHRKQPGGGILETLIEASDNGDQLSEDEVIAAIYILIGAGHETTANLLGNGLAHLLSEHRDQWELLCSQPSLVPSAVEELLRFDTSVQFNQRVANQPIVYRGFEMAESDRIIVLLGAANRDPEVFPDPHRLDIRRDPNPHLSFGAGAYHCLGTHLARLEMQIALDALVRNAPKLATAGTPEWRATWMMTGLERLPVMF